MSGEVLVDLGNRGVQVLDPLIEGRRERPLLRESATGAIVRHHARPRQAEPGGDAACHELAPVDLAPQQLPARSTPQQVFLFLAFDHRCPPLELYFASSRTESTPALRQMVATRASARNGESACQYSSKSRRVRASRFGLAPALSGCAGARSPSSSSAACVVEGDAIDLARGFGRDPVLAHVDRHLLPPAVPSARRSRRRRRNRRRWCGPRG